ncbi:MAG: hypothetical protein WBQ00_02815, partial [Terriglobales bacterium]
MQLLQKTIAGFFLAAIFSVPVFAEDTSHTATPGTLNYVEGNVSIASEALSSKSIGSAELQSGQFLTTEKGKAEVLLTPGVFLRVGDNSTVKMISPSLTDTEIGLDKGHAIVEVAEIHPENDILIDANGVKTRLEKTGLYDFNLNQDQLRVFDGKAFVEEPGQHTTVKAGREIALAVNQPLKPEKFDKRTYEEGDLYRWSSLRSAYVAEANLDAAGLYAENGYGPWGMGWWGADWYWDPWFSAFTFIPGDGIFYSPFGWGFYSPWWIDAYPFFGGGYGFGGYGYGYRPFLHHFTANSRNWGGHSPYIGSSRYSNGIYHGPGSSGSDFHSGRMVSGSRGFGAFGGGLHGSSGFHGGGFHGGGGGFGGSGFGHG